MEFTDTHTHTYLSGHGEGTVDEVVQAAILAGLSTIAITEHLPLPKTIDKDGIFAMTTEQVPIYLDAVHAAQERYKKIEIICGVEIDWRCKASDYILEQLALNSNSYELKLGSVHMITGDSGGLDGNFWEFDYPPHIDGWSTRGPDNVWQQYFTLWSEAVSSPVPFDVMSHPDLPKKLGFKPGFDTRELYAAMAELAAQKDVLIEVNTSGLRNPVAELYPSDALLKAFCEAKVGCTVSSDAHHPKDIGRDLHKAHAAMLRAGYKEVTVPTKSGDRRKIKLV